ncbi:sugar porter family MFS transporter [Pedobacter sp. LMG 31462]|uniref:Sugar porter family MFS transporter n=2 Tax=Pedobacter gandavensis TaxID=2679963 RepID=A0ABR6ETL2_9SPHI|nr:sugar porter family MFS transporter [Pedobacter gandavensis]
MTNHKTFLLLITMIAALGGFLFGFDMAVVSGIIEPLKLQFNLTSAQEGWFVSSALLGCIGGVAFSGYLSDQIGRKKVLFIAALLFFISAVGFASSGSYTLLIFFRILAGVGVGVASNISPLYISEMSPAKNRGSLVTYYQLALTIGILLAYVSNYCLQGHASAAGIVANPAVLDWLFVSEVWRGMFLVGVIPAVLFCFLIFFVPESPRWLLQKGRVEEAKTILSSIHGEKEGAIEMAGMNTGNVQVQGSFKALFNGPVRKVLILVMVLTALAQFSGINGVIFYGPTILKSAGFVTNDALLYQMILGTANVLFTFIAIWKVDTWGRRPLYLTGAMMAAAALALTGLCFLFGIKGMALVSCIITFLFAFAFSLGPLKFVIATELFPTAVRGRALSICIMTMWIADWLVNLMFPLMRDGLGIPATFFIFAFFCLFTFWYVKRNLPETKGQSLEEIEKDLIR